MADPGALALPLPERGRMQATVAAGGMLAIALGTLLIGMGGWRYGALFLIGALLGVTLYHAGFGFTSAYRHAILRRDVSGILAQLVLLGLTMTLFAPFLAAGEAFGRPLGGLVMPVGVRVAIGSFLFGLGMQLGGGCGSGTLYTAGGGNGRMIVTLLAFCLGGFLATLDLARWASLPALGPVSLGREFGFGPALALQLGMLLLIWFGLRAWARGHPQKSLRAGGLGNIDWLRGPWPVLVGAVLLAFLALAVLLVGGRPWGITWAFAVWTAKFASALGWDPASSAFWGSDFGQHVLAQSVFRMQTSLTDFGILVGALTAAGFAGRFRPFAPIPFRPLLAALLGGLLMGYGARLAFGCNIGAFFSGVASFSLHGWLWIVCALVGTWLGIHLRPWFGLRN
jgi:uncharacterized membrane protein YedE/YeeE